MLPFYRSDFSESSIMQNSKQTRDVVNLTGSPTRTSSHYWNAVKEKSPGRKLPWGLCLTDLTKPQQSFLSQAWLCLVSGTEPSLEKDPRLNKLNMPSFHSLFPVQHCCPFCLPPSHAVLVPGLCTLRSGALPGAFQLDLSRRSWKVGRQIHQLPTYFSSLSSWTLL